MAVGTKQSRRGRVRFFGGFAPACALALALALAVAPAAVPAESSPGEYDVKAAFLLNFARLVEWPGSTFSDAHSPLEVGLLSSVASSQTLGKFLDGKMVGSRRVATRRIAGAEEADDLHMIFVGASEGVSAGAIANATRGRAVLVVGESEGFATSGGTINFFTEDNRVRFEINPGAASAAGLRVSSRLLRVARIVSEAR